MFDILNFDLFAAFCAAAVILLLIPGPVVTLVVANSLKHGTRVGITTVLGASLGNAVLIICGAVGITTMMALMAELFQIVRWVGAAYLIYLGIMEWRSRGMTLDEAEAAPPRTTAKVFGTAFLIALTNPKAILFYIAFFPQFIDPALPANPQLVAMVTAFIVLALFLDGCYAVLSGRLRNWFADKRRARFQGKVTGTLLMATGIGLALARKSD